MAQTIAPKVTHWQELNVTHHSDRVIDMRTDQEREAFSKRLNEICDDMGVPPKGDGRQLRLAKRFEVNQKGARKWLEGEAMPQMTTMIAIARWADVNIEWLITGRGEKRNTNVVQQPVSPYLARVECALSALPPAMQGIAVAHIEALAKASSAIEPSGPTEGTPTVVSQHAGSPPANGGKKRAAA